jgi:hypothetical protein
LALYEADPEEKHLCGGAVVMVMMKSYDYDPKQGLEWAKAHGMCLALDSKAFKDICKAESTRPGFVTVQELATAKIAADLTSFVEAD